MKNKKYYKCHSLKDSTSTTIKNFLLEIQVPFTNHYLDDNLLNHPKYPSLSSISDILTDYRIENLNVKIGINELFEIGAPAIAYLTEKVGYFVLITEINLNYIIYIDPIKGKIKSETKEFTQKWNGVVLMAEKSKISAEKNYSSNRKTEILNAIKFPALILFSLLFTISIALSSLQLPSSILNDIIPLIALKVVGFATSIIIIIKEYKLAKNAFVENVCKLGGWSKNIDCQNVFESNSLNFLGIIGLTDLCLWYFSSTFLLSAFLVYASAGQFSLWFLSIISFFTLPITFISIYYQTKVIKQICPLCLFISLILWSEFIILINHWDIRIPSLSLQELGILFFSFSTSLILWIFIKPYLSKTETILYNRRQLEIFKRSHGAFKSVLEESKTTNITYSDTEIFLGNANSDNVIMLILSPHCKACHKAYKEALTIQEELSDIKIIIRLQGGDFSMNKFSEIILSYRVLEGNNKAISLLTEWFTRTETDVLSFEHKNPIPYNIEIERINDTMNSWGYWGKQERINATPTIIFGNKKIPYQFNLEDVRIYLKNNSIYNNISA